MTGDPLALMGTYRKHATLVDGTYRVVIDIDPPDAPALVRMLGVPGTTLAIARLRDDAAQQAVQAQKREAGDFGQYAHDLDASGFWLRPEVWRAAGSDAQFLEWLRAKPCAWHRENGRPQSTKTEAAHVRRIANGSGTGIKPEYSAIPLCDDCHREQHQHGESAVGGREWFDKQRVSYLREWARTRVKTHLGYDSWKHVPPETTIDWAREHDVAHRLPAIFQIGAQAHG